MDTPKDVWLGCGKRVTNTRPDQGCRCTGWNDVPHRWWHVPAELNTSEKIQWINDRTGNRKPFRRPREWRP